MSRTVRRGGLIALAAAVPLLIAPSMAAAAPVVISEFRTQGPQGGNDEFVEIRNTTSSSIDISNWRLAGCASTSGNPSTRATVGAGTTLPAGASFLFVNTAASGYSGTVPGDATYTTGIANSGNSGLRIENGSGGVVDTVGHSASPCREGTGLNFGAFGNVNQSYERLGASAGQDTDNNSADFALRTTADPQNCGTACAAPPPPCPAPPGDHADPRDPG
ncbi:lamin tail domain-containing protein [Svornostia abyssi]|uniref:Lamin tail domain-containing protein n=1 Tax=Svornostia abyssi TaxID=2898438 RepID=A0ABY5PB58_9ACTN|nr:lamin tail domain-containing protein [Parviterribacteraceae bacterium J379]